MGKPGDRLVFPKNRNNFVATVKKNDYERGCIYPILTGAKAPILLGGSLSAHSGECLLFNFNEISFYRTLSHRAHYPIGFASW
ncbi:hypothetical protein, partial [uncultured Anaerovibrio sp.]|uniref:hypothetical protein n=1 Tax=uncultured Anaerovibrio sp. TaxID=361586 RepID=UPI002636B31C